MIAIQKFSMGVGDRFARQGEAQLRAMVEAMAAGVAVAPVWNKSHREHTLVGSSPGDVRVEADEAVRKAGWKHAYFVDADHIGLKNVGGFIESCDFFTLDVADFVGKQADDADIRSFAADNRPLLGKLSLPGVESAFLITDDLLDAAARKYLRAAQEAGRIYRAVEAARGRGTFVTEVSMDETDQPQTPAELLVILSAIAREGIPAQTIAPKFSGRFNKGVDYVGSVDRFAGEFDADVAVVEHAKAAFGLPKSLKLSVHSGSDKFSIYPAINRVLRKRGAGLHLKTAGTTWLEEIAGLAEAGPDGLQIARSVYRSAVARREELCGPYATVLDIKHANLPDPDEVDRWDGERYAAAVRHDQSSAFYNADMRQILHVGYKVAAEMGRVFTQALEESAEHIGRGVTKNLVRRHIMPVFGGCKS